MEVLNTKTKVIQNVNLKETLTMVGSRLQKNEHREFSDEEELSIVRFFVIYFELLSQALGVNEIPIR